MSLYVPTISIYLLTYKRSSVYSFIVTLYLHVPLYILSTTIFPYKALYLYVYNGIWYILYHYVSIYIRPSCICLYILFTYIYIYLLSLYNPIELLTSRISLYTHFTSAYLYIDTPTVYIPMYIPLTPLHCYSGFIFMYIFIYIFYLYILEVYILL